VNEQLSYAVTCAYMDASPASRVRLPSRDADCFETHPMAAEETRRFLAAASTIRSTALWILCAYAACSLPSCWASEDRDAASAAVEASLDPPSENRGQSGEK